MRPVPSRHSLLHPMCLGWHLRPVYGWQVPSQSGPSRSRWWRPGLPPIVSHFLLPRSTQQYLLGVSLRMLDLFADLPLGNRHCKLPDLRRRVLVAHGRVLVSLPPWHPPQPAAEWMSGLHDGLPILPVCQHLCGMFPPLHAQPIPKVPARLPVHCLSALPLLWLS